MFENQTAISLYNEVKDNTGTPTTVQDVLSLIKSGNHHLADKIEILRNTANAKDRDNLKKQLPGVTFSGLFSKRKAENLEQYSGLICMDIDKLPNPEYIKHLLTTEKKDGYLYACFISPSGNGLKLLYATNCGAANHAAVFSALATYLKISYDITIDESGKDTSRLCFLSHDPELYENPECESIKDEFLQKYAPAAPAPAPVKKLPKSNTPAPEKTTADLLDDVRTFTDNKLTYTEGKRNKYIMQFACNANRRGIDVTDTLEYCNYNFSDLEFSEIRATVKSAYSRKNTADEFGKYATKQHNTPAPEKTTAKKAPRPAQTDTDEFNTDVLFWYEEIVTNEKTGKEKKQIKFSYDKGIKFLENNGFFKIPMENNNYQFIRVQNNIIEIVKERNMREFMLDYLKTDEKKFMEVREMFRRGAKQYGATHYLEGLPFFYPDFKKDDEKTAFIYFKNCYLEITAESIETRSYANLSGNIWKKQIIDFDFNFKEYTGCVYDRFLQLAVIGKEQKEDVTYNDEDTEKFNSIRTTIGYMLHQYKDAANPKAVIGVDQKLRDGKEDNGGTGKSMFAKALSKLIYTCTMDGKNFKFDAPYPFEKLNLDHSLINFNDVQKNFDFERLYGLLTEEFTYSKKYIDAITIPFENSPKFYLSTNKTIKGSGNSVTRRQHIIEFSSYFNADRTPQKVFGHMFFYHWDKDEYNQFYLFMIHSIQYFLQNGLLPFPLKNYQLNKLIDTAGDEFIDYMNDTVLDSIDTDPEHEVKILFDNYITKVRGSYKERTAQNTFSKYVRQWCELHNLEINRHKNGERDRRNGKDYYTFFKIQNEDEDIF